MLHIQGWVVPEVHIKCGNRFFVEIRPPQNPIIFCIFSKFLHNFDLQRFVDLLIFRFFRKYLRWKHLEAKIHRNFDNMQKLSGFCGGRISTKNRFMDVIWTPVTFYPSFHHLTRETHNNCKEKFLLSPSGVMEWWIKCHGGSYNVHESILCRNSTPAKSTYFLHIVEKFSVYFCFQMFSA